MLQNISWADYIMVVTGALIIYYLFVGVKYFSSEIRELLAGKRMMKFRMSHADAGASYDESEETYQQADNSFENTTDSAFAEVEHIIERLKSVISDASHRKLVLEEFKQYIRMVLKEYPSIKQSPLRLSVNELIISECQKYGVVTLKEEDVELLWKEAV